jgi:hypothetical protein
LEQDSGDRTTAHLAAHNQTVQKEQAYWIEANLTQWYLWSQTPGRGNWVCQVKKIYRVVLRVMVVVCWGSTAIVLMKNAGGIWVHIAGIN